MLARAEGGRVETFVTTLLAALGGLADADAGIDVEADVKFLVGGLIGSRLGDWLPLSLLRGSGNFTLLASLSPGSGAREGAVARVSLEPASDGLRSERDRGGAEAIVVGHDPFVVHLSRVGGNNSISAMT